MGNWKGSGDVCKIMNDGLKGWGRGGFIKKGCVYCVVNVLYCDIWWNLIF